jgi:hypothetical protein
MTRKRIRIVQDRDGEGPREYDNLGTMVCWHRRYNLGDEQPKIPPSEYMESVPKGSIVLPLYLFDHSGITMSTTPFNDPWDSGQVGFIYISPDKIRKEYSVKRITPKLRTDIEGYLRSEVEVYDQFLRGEVYGYILEEAEIDEDFDDEDEEIEWEEIDSCWGFYGSDPFKNGISDHIPEELHGLLKVAEPEYA